MEEIVSNALAKMNEEMANPHSSSEDTIHNWLCEQTEDEELMNAILTDGKTIKSSLAYVTQKVKESAKGQMAVLTDQEVFQLVRDYYLSLESKIEHDPSVKVLANGDKVREVTKEVVKEITVSLDKKSKQSLETILELDVSNDEKIRLLQSLIKTESEEVKETEENMSIFDFGLEFEDE